MQQEFSLLEPDAHEDELWLFLEQHCKREDVAQLLRIGMNGGRKLIEQPRPARKRKDKLTLSLFDERMMF